MSPSEPAESDEPQLSPWSRNRVKRLGNELRDGVPSPHSELSFQEYAQWHTELTGYICALLFVEDWAPLLGKMYEPEISGRVKTDDTLIAKLRRERTFPLHSIQDVSGIRFEARMTLDEQSVVVDRIAEIFDERAWSVSINDYRAGGHLGNYRAVHLVVERRADRARAEIQVRTVLQSKWANVYEALADVWGRNIRYGALPADSEARRSVASWQEQSISLIKQFEELENRYLADPMGESSQRLKKTMGELHNDIVTSTNEVAERLREDRSGLV